MKKTRKHVTVLWAVCAAAAIALAGCGEKKVTYPADLTDYELEDGTFTGHAEQEGPTGEGKITYTNGDVYEGTVAAGKAEGNGKITYANGDVYEGTVTAGKAEGNGKITYANGDRYEGAVADGKPQGEGVMVTGEGTYTGAFSGGLFEDDDAEMVFEGGTYKGGFSQGKMKGEGEFTWKDGHVFTGTFDGVGEGAGELTGTGFLAYTTGLSFDGTLLDGNPKTGTFYWPNNSSAWVGEFTAFLTGYGTLDMGNGIIYYGPMNAGVLMGNDEWDARDEKVTIQYPEAGAYTGETFEGAYSVNEETLKDELIGTITMKDGTVVENVHINLNFSFQYSAE